MNDNANRVEPAVRSNGKRSASPLTLWQNGIWDAKLRGNVAHVALALGQCMNTNTLEATASLETLADKAGLARSTVQLALAELKEKKWLDWTPGGRHKDTSGQWVGDANEYVGMFPPEYRPSAHGERRKLARSEYRHSVHGPSTENRIPTVGNLLIGDPKGSPLTPKDLKTLKKLTDDETALPEASGADNDDQQHTNHVSYHPVGGHSASPPEAGSAVEPTSKFEADGSPPGQAGSPKVPSASKVGGRNLKVAPARVVARARALRTKFIDVTVEIREHLKATKPKKFPSLAKLSEMTDELDELEERELLRKLDEFERWMEDEINKFMADEYRRYCELYE